MIDIGAILRSWYRGKGVNRFETARVDEQVINPFDQPTALIQDMIARDIRPVTVQTISLAVAGELLLQVPGAHIVIYGHDGSANKAVNTTAYMEMWWGNSKKSYQGYPLKHARGFSGPFEQLYVKWPAQSNVYVDIVILSGLFTPWIDGESCT